MHYYENGRPVLSMKVVVGKPNMRTPVFHRKMQYIMENPRWNVPPSIYAKEYAGKSESYLRKKVSTTTVNGSSTRNREAGTLWAVSNSFSRTSSTSICTTPRQSIFSTDTEGPIRTAASDWKNLLHC